MPNPVFEAMACGKNILAPPVGGILEILEDGKNGVIVNVNDATTLAEKIQELLINAEKRMSLGKNAREIIMNRFIPAKELEANLEMCRKPGISLT